MSIFIIILKILTFLIIRRFLRIKCSQLEIVFFLFKLPFVTEPTTLHVFVRVQIR